MLEKDTQASEEKLNKHVEPHPIYNFKNFMKYVDRTLEMEKRKQQNKEESWITIKGNHIKLKDG